MFNDFLYNFVFTVQPRKEKFQLLIIDSHESHLSVKAIQVENDSPCNHVISQKNKKSLFIKNDRSSDEVSDLGSVSESIEADPKEGPSVQRSPPFSALYVGNFVLVLEKETTEGSTTVLVKSFQNLQRNKFQFQKIVGRYMD